MWRGCVRCSPSRTGRRASVATGTAVRHDRARRGHSERSRHCLRGPVRLDEGESIGAVLGQGEPTPRWRISASTIGLAWYPEDDFLAHFAADTNPADANIMYAVQHPLKMDAFDDVMGTPAWKQRLLVVRGRTARRSDPARCRASVCTAHGDDRRGAGVEPRRDGLPRRRNRRPRRDRGPRRDRLATKCHSALADALPNGLAFGAHRGVDLPTRVLSDVARDSGHTPSRRYLPLRRVVATATT